MSGQPSPPFRLVIVSIRLRSLLNLQPQSLPPCLKTL
jgi:hypothetical protein